MSYKTEQEAFWAGQFGDEYRERCSLEPELVAARTACMARMLRKAAPVKSAFEIGCNIGLNLKALNRVSPQTELAAIEINEESTRQANALGMARVETASRSLRPHRWIRWSWQNPTVKRTDRERG